MLFAVSYGVAAAAFVALIALMLINRTPRGLGIAVFAACLITTVWATACAVQQWWLPGVAHLLDTARGGAWLVLLASILAKAKENWRRALWLPIGMLAITVAAVANDCRFLLSTRTPEAFADSQIYSRILISVAAIAVIENLYRNASKGRRWNLSPLCIAIASMFAYDLYVFCEAVVLNGASPTLLAGRGILAALAVPLLVLTMSRNPGWKIDIHVSRGAVFHGATLVGAGIFLLLAAGAARFIGGYPGPWAGLSEIGFFCGSIILLLIVLSTESLRSRVRRLIADNFFSTRYDYRAEWLRTIATLSSSDTHEPLTVRAIRALADVVDSPGGALWLESTAGDFRIAQTSGMMINAATVENRDGDFISQFRNGQSIHDFTENPSIRPPWADQAWLAVPLMKLDRLMGLVVLAPPRAPTKLDWESADLLLAIGQQVASYLEEERATRTLMESQALIDYSRRFSFIVHDVKNVSGQLGLIISNIRKFGDRADFRADMIRGMEGAARKLQSLMDRLRPDAPMEEADRLVSAAEAIATVADELGRKDSPVRAEIGDRGVRLRMPQPQLHAVLTHLITNAQEASSPGNEVMVRLQKGNDRVAIEITDHGEGMTAEFISNGLFIPSRSTKPSGHGMGAYQARVLVHAAGGELEVISAIGRGTTMRILLPDPDSSAASLCQEVA